MRWLVLFLLTGVLTSVSAQRVKIGAQLERCYDALGNVSDSCFVMTTSTGEQSYITFDEMELMFGADDKYLDTVYLDGDSLVLEVLGVDTFKVLIERDTSLWYLSLDTAINKSSVLKIKLDADTYLKGKLFDFYDEFGSTQTVLSADSAGNPQYKDETDLRPIHDSELRELGHLEDIFQISYVTDVGYNVIDRPNDIIVSNATANSFTTNMTDWLVDINPLPSGEKWAIYITNNTGSDVDPRAVVDSFDIATGTVYFSTAGVTGGTAPVNGNAVEFYNPFVNMQNIRGDGPLLAGYVDENAIYGTTSYTVDFVNPADVFRKSDGTYVIGLNVRTTGTLNSIIGFVETRDFQEYTVVNPVLDGHTVTPLATRLAFTSIYKWDQPNSDSTLYVLFFMHVDGDGDDDPYYMVIDENYNTVVGFTPLPLGDYQTTSNSFQLFDLIVYEGRIRIVGWDWSPTTAQADKRRTVEWTMNTSDIGKVLDGSAYGVMKIIHRGDGPEATGLMDSQIDTWRYVDYENKLHAIHTYYQRIGGHMTFSNRGYMISTLDHNDEWVHDRSGRIMAAATQWEKIDAKYSWQADHMGGTPALVSYNGDWIFICAMKTNSANTYTSAGYYLTDHSQEDIYRPYSVPRLNHLQVANLTGLSGGELVFRTDTNRLMYYDGTVWKTITP